MAGEETELIDNDLADRDGGAGTAAQDARPSQAAAQAGAGDTSEESAEVLAFHPRSDDAGSAESGEAHGSPEPVDLPAMNADDALLNALGGTDPHFTSNSEDMGPGLEELLVAWRRDVDGAPFGDLVDLDTAAATIAEASRPRRIPRRWHLVPVASAAAVLMITFTGVGLAARDALPGDMLWGVAQVLYTDHARAAQAAETAREQLDAASYEWDQGNAEAAEAALTRAEEHMETVDAEHGLADLEAAKTSLAAKFEQDPNPAENSSSASSSQPGSTSAPSSSEPSTWPMPQPVPPPSGDPSSTPTTPNGSPESSSSPSGPSDSSEPQQGTPWQGSNDPMFPSSP